MATNSITSSSSKADIKNVQNPLIILGYLEAFYINSEGQERSNADGIWGTKTVAAVKSAQIDALVPENGNVASPAFLNWIDAEIEKDDEPEEDSSDDDILGEDTPPTAAPSTVYDADFDPANPFKDIDQTANTTWDFQQRVLTLQHHGKNDVLFITLNQIVSSSIDARVLLGTEGERYDASLDTHLPSAIKTATGFGTLIEQEDFLDQTQATPFSVYYSKKMDGTKSVFNFLNRRLKRDLNSKKKNLKTNGIDFEQHFLMLDRIPNDIKSAINNRYPSAGTFFANSDNKDKYQVSLLSSKNSPSKFLGAVVFAPHMHTRNVGERKITEATISRLFLDPNDFPKDCPLNSTFFSFLGYMSSLDLLSKLGKSDLKAAENKMNCGLLPDHNQPPLLDYLYFSKAFHQPNQITESTDAVENSKKRAESPISVSGYLDAIDSGTTELVSKIASLTTNQYTVTGSDSMSLSVPRNSTWTSGSVPGAQLHLFDYNTPWHQVSATDIIEANRADPATMQKFYKNWSTLGNALSPGMVINIPKAPPSLHQLEKSLTAAVTEMDTSNIKKIWEEVFTDKLLSKLCPATLPTRLLECLLPQTCRELIKYIGLWRTRDVLENFILFDIYDDANGLAEALTKWDALVESRYSFKAVEFSGDGLLKTGALNSEDVYPDTMNDVSVSFQVRVMPKHAEINEGKTKVIFMQKDSFEIKKTPTGKIQVVLYSPEGKVSRYTSESTDILTNDQRSIGFSWAGTFGNFTLYVDGIEKASTMTSGEVFTGPLAATDDTRFIVASENHEKSQKGFAGQIDELAIFNQVLTTEQWRNIAKIDSDVNLNTLLLAPFATAWWRMGDSSKDLTSSDKDDGKIIDLIGDKDLTAVGPDGTVEIKVVRLFKEKDEDRFIDIINRETNIEKVCSQIIDYIMIDIEKAFDPRKLKRDLLDQIKIPNFSRDPHEQLEVIIDLTVVEGLVKVVASFLALILEQLLNCDSWKGMVKALVRGTLNADGTQVLSAVTENNPIAKFVSATQNPEEWASILAGTEDYFLKGITTSLASGIQMHQSGSNGEHKYTTLGIGPVQFKEEQEQDSEVLEFSTINDSIVTIQTWEGTNSQEVVINLVKKITEELPPDSLLALFASSATQSTLATAAQILNTFSDEIGISFSLTDTQMFFGTIGSSLGLQDAIDQLRHAAELVSQQAEDPEFCMPSQNNQDRLNIPLDEFQKALNKAMVQDILDQTDEINSQADSGNNSDNTCSIPIPLSQAETTSLQRTINDVFSPVLLAYDSDLILYKLGLSSIATETKTIKKVLWKGDKELVTTADDQGNLREEVFEIEKTVINPEFEGMLEQGFVPLKEDGTPDGSRVGGVVKVNWNILDLFKEEGGFLSEIRPPKSLSPTVDGDKVTDPDVEIKDLGSSLGPYTDYTEDRYARVPISKVKLGGNATSALSSDITDFLLEDSRGDDEASYFNLRGGSSRRGIKNIETKSRTSLIAPPVAPDTSSPSSYSTISHEVKWGRSLEGEKFIGFQKTGPDPITLDPIAVPFNVSSELQEAINAMGYDAGPAECDALGALANEGSGVMSSEQFTPQEYLFSDIVNNLGNTTRISTSQMKTDVYNSLYREVMTSILYFVAESPLLKPVPGITDASNEPMPAINFLNLDIQPRLIDMESFATQVAEDYSTISACPDGLTEPPLYTALKTAAPRILARVYIVDIALRAIVPFSQLFFSEKDPIIQGLIMKKIEQDVNIFADDPAGLKAKIVQQYNSLADTGLIDEPSVPEDEFETKSFETAMRYFIKDEFNFVTNRLKETVHGECIPVSEENKETVKKEMYKAVLRYADLGNKDIKIETYAITKETETEEPKKLKTFSLKNQIEEIETVGTSLSYFYNDKEIVLSRVEQSAEDLLKELGIDFDNIDCDNSSIYSASGFTTVASEPDHHHAYTVDAEGKGVTTTTEGDGEPHTHAIYNYAIVPRFDEQGTVSHIHTLIPRNDQDAIDQASVMAKVTGAMRDKLMETDSFKALFDFSFDLNDISSMIMLYCLQSADDQIMSRVFNNTKKNTITMFDWLWENNQAIDPCAAEKSAALAIDFADMFPDMASAFLNPELLLMMLVAPLTTYKGWSKTADPHVFITSTITELLNLPILPKNVKKNIPNLIPGDSFGELECRNWPDFKQAMSPLDTLFAGGKDVFNPVGPPYDIPPLYVPAPAIEGAVALGVTYAPLIVGLPPFPPTPYGMIYYLAVSPLIWLLKDLPRLLKMIEESEDGKRALASTGLNVGPISCEDQTPEEAIDAGVTTTAEDDEGCPPVKEFQETMIEVGNPKEC